VGDSVSCDHRLSPAAAGCNLSVRGSWSFATLHPGLYAVARGRGLMAVPLNADPDRSDPNPDHSDPSPDHSDPSPDRPLSQSEPF